MDGMAVPRSSDVCARVARCRSGSRTAKETATDFHSKYTGFEGVYCEDKDMDLGKLLPKQPAVWGER